MLGLASSKMTVLRSEIAGLRVSRRCVGLLRSRVNHPGGAPFEVDYDRRTHLGLPFVGRFEAHPRRAAERLLSRFRS